MKVEHLGKVMDMEPQQAAVENSIVRYLKRCGPLTQKALWLRVRGRGLTAVEFKTAIDALVDRDIVARQTTHYVNSFVLKLQKQAEGKRSTPTS